MWIAHQNNLSARRAPSTILKLWRTNKRILATAIPLILSTVKSLARATKVYRAKARETYLAKNGKPTKSLEIADPFQSFKSPATTAKLALKGALRLIYRPS
jgi:hypothetical protein